MFKYGACLAKTFVELGKRSVDYVAGTGATNALLRNIHITSLAAKEVRQTEGVPKKVLVGVNKWDIADDGSRYSVRLDTITDSGVDMFPNSQTPDMKFDNVCYKDLPCVHVKATPNNTLIVLTEANGHIILCNTCGLEGYKNARKGTNVAAQQTATTFSKKAAKAGYKNVRVLLQGIGPGRTASLKGLELGGLNIVSITDNTRVSWNPVRARKRRRL